MDGFFHGTTSFIALVIFLMAVVNCACSVLKKGLKYTVGKVLFWTVVGITCSIIGMCAIIVICQKYNAMIEATTFEVIHAIVDVSIIAASAMILCDDKEQKLQ